MIAGLDSSFSVPSAAQLADAKAHGVRMWCGYLATRPGSNLGHPWTKADFARVKKAGLAAVAFCSGLDDPIACKDLAAAWGVLLCLDVEQTIRPDGPWVKDWLSKSGAGLYGNAPVFSGRRPAFSILAAYPGHDPHRTWTTDPHHPAPPGPCGWQWQGTHEEFGCNVDRGWYDDWFAGGKAGGRPAETHWASLGGSFRVQPALAQNLDGRLELLVAGRNGHLFDLAQSAPNGSWWTNWVDLGGLPGGAAGNVTVGRNLDGRLEVFLRGGDGEIHRRPQKGPGGALAPAWSSLGGSFTHDPVVAHNLDGRLELFVLGDDGRVFSLPQSSPNGRWRSSWADLGGPLPGGVGGGLSVGRNLDGRVALFARSADASIHHRPQQTGGGALTPSWTSLGGSFGQLPAVAQNLDGRLELLAVGKNGHLFDLAQKASGGSWGTSWVDLGGPPPGGASGALAVGRNLDGRLEAFLRGKDGRIYHRWQQGAGGALTPTWASLGGSAASGPRVGCNQNGRLEVFVLGANRHVQHAWQVAPNDGWA